MDDLDRFRRRTVIGLAIGAIAWVAFVVALLTWLR